MVFCKYDQSSKILINKPVIDWMINYGFEALAKKFVLPVILDRGGFILNRYAEGFIQSCDIIILIFIARSNMIDTKL